MKAKLPSAISKLMGLIYLTGLFALPVFGKRPDLPRPISNNIMQTNPLKHSGLTNTAPVVMDDYAHLVINSSVTGSFVYNDYDPDGDSLSIFGVTINTAAGPILIQTVSTDQGGTVSFYTDGSYFYTSPANFTGDDQVIYTECDVNPSSLCNSATIVFHVETGNPLPVIFSSFNGRRSGKEVLLQWTTAQEINCDHYDVQFCTDNSRFLTIASIKAAGSSLPLEYNYIHINPAGPVNYYRIRLLDHNGKATYSKVVAIKNDDGQGVLLQTVYPNPFRDKIELAITNNASGKLTINFYDLNGKTMVTREEHCVMGLNLIRIDNLNNLPCGEYFIDVSGSERLMKGKVVKEK